MRMKTIGRILSYVLLAAAFAKNVLTINAANVAFLKVQSDEVARDSNGTRLELISGLSLNSNIFGSPRNNMFQSKVDQGKIKFHLHTFNLRKNMQIRNGRFNSVG